MSFGEQLSAGSAAEDPQFCAMCGVVHRATSELDADLERRRTRHKRRRVKRLVVAPHCDDEVLGCGGLLAKHSDECTVLVLAKPDEVRRKEFEEAKRILGYAEALFLDIPDGYVHEDMRRLVDEIDRVVRALEPHELYLPFPSMHQDHVAGYEAGVRAGRLSMRSDHWFTPSIYVYDVTAYDVQLYPTELRFNVFEALEERDIDRKVEAAAQYASQTVMGPHPANILKEHANAVGSARQVQWAESFALVRTVRQ